jgi:hypothetical protein
MDDRDLSGDTQRRSVLGPVLALLIAFLLGIALTAYAVRRWDKIASWLHPQPVVGVDAKPAPRIIARPRPVAPPSDAELANRVNTIESRVNAVEARTAETTGDADRAEALLVAFAARRALDRGQPLGYLEGLLRERFGGTDAASVALIIATAQRPITLTQLQDSFATLGPTLIAADPHESWWAGLRRQLGSLLIVRRADTPSPLPINRLARANRALEQGHVDDAAAEVARMPGAARAADWLASARRYILARGALDSIETAALLKPPVGATPAPAPAEN